MQHTDSSNCGHNKSQKKTNVKTKGMINVSSTDTRNKYIRQKKAIASDQSNMNLYVI